MAWYWKHLANRFNPITDFFFQSTSFFFKNDLKQFRNSQRKCSMKKMVLKISQNSQGNTSQTLFFKKVADLRSATLLKKRFWCWCFPVNFAKFLRTPPGGWLPLTVEDFVSHSLTHPFTLILTYSISHSLTLKVTHWMTLSPAQWPTNSYILPFINKTFCWCNIDNNISSIIQKVSFMFLLDTFFKYILNIFSYFKLSDNFLDWCYE